MITAVLFDLDGLLADTETLHCKAYQAVLHTHGLELTDDQYRDAWIRQGLGIADYLSARGLDIDPAVLRTAKAAEYERLVESDCGPMPGALALLERLHGRKTLAVASSSYADAVAAVLARLGVRDRFEAVVSGSDVARVKPAPDIFLLAARRLGVAPEHCVVIEDAEKGLVAAKAAGMKCICVPSAHTADNDFTKADVVVRSLDQVTVEVIDRL